MKIQKLVLAAGLVFGLSFAMYAGDNNTKDASKAKDDAKAKTETVAQDDQQYTIFDVAGNTTVFTGNADDVDSYNSTNYTSCNGTGSECTRVYQAGHVNDPVYREPSLERKHNP